MVHPPSSSLEPQPAPMGNRPPRCSPNASLLELRRADPFILLALAAALILSAAVPLFAAVELRSPGLPPSHMDDQGRLVEDWGAVQVSVVGPNPPAPTTAEVRSTRIDDVVPAAEARWRVESLEVRTIAYRAPIWPSGVDVLQVQVEETTGQPTSARLELALPEGAGVGARTASVGGRAVLALPEPSTIWHALREWGCLDDATALPGWARPAKPCDPAFANIRAGLGGVPIRYRFKVEPKSRCSVVLGFCESHWSQSGQRPVVCQVEGAPLLEVDPLAKWGQHQPGALLFNATDENGDGLLDVSVLPKIGAPDLNPILNVLWLFRASPGENLDAVIAGRFNAAALRYVDVGGEKDQALIGSGKIEYAIELPAKGTREWTFLVACPGGTVPMPERTAWTSESLCRAAARVAKEWRE